MLNATSSVTTAWNRSGWTSSEHQLDIKRASRDAQPAVNRDASNEAAGQHADVCRRATGSASGKNRPRNSRQMVGGNLVGHRSAILLDRLLRVQQDAQMRKQLGWQACVSWRAGMRQQPGGIAGWPGRAGRKCGQAGGSRRADEAGAVAAGSSEVPPSGLLRAGGSDEHGNDSYSGQRRRKRGRTEGGNGLANLFRRRVLADGRPRLPEHPQPNEAGSDEKQERDGQYDNGHQAEEKPVRVRG